MFPEIQLFVIGDCISQANSIAPEQVVLAGKIKNFYCYSINNEQIKILNI